MERVDPWAENTLTGVIKLILENLTVFRVIVSFCKVLQLITDPVINSEDVYTLILVNYVLVMLTVQSERVLSTIVNEEVII